MVLTSLWGQHNIQKCFQSSLEKRYYQNAYYTLVYLQVICVQCSLIKHTVLMGTKTCPCAYSNTFSVCMHVCACFPKPRPHAGMQTQKRQLFNRMRCQLIACSVGKKKKTDSVSFKQKQESYNNSLFYHYAVMEEKKKIFIISGQQQNKTAQLSNLF